MRIDLPFLGLTTRAAVAYAPVIMRGVGSGVFVLACLVTPAGAAAQEGMDPALAPCRAAFDRAQSAYDRELFTEAEDGFRESFNCMPPTAERRAYIMMNIALSIERQGGRDAEALEAWETFRRDAEAFAEPEHLVRADGRIREIRARIERRGATGEGAESIHPLGPIVLAVGGAALIAGFIVGGFGLSERSSVLAECTGSTCPSSVEGRARDVATYGLVADSLIWPGIALTAVGLVLTLVLREESAGSNVALGPNGVEVHW